MLVDEAYHDYVTAADYASAAPLALAQPGVLVTRTLSKAHGMAGLRVGYALGQGDTIKALARYRLSFNVNVLGLAAAIGSLRDPEAVRLECQRNAEARSFTLGVLEQLGCHASESQANFVFAEVKRPAREFREACRTLGPSGRDFHTKTHARVSIGTRDEMRRAAAPSAPSRRRAAFLKEETTCPTGAPSFAASTAASPAGYRGRGREALAALGEDVTPDCPRPVRSS